MKTKPIFLAGMLVTAILVFPLFSKSQCADNVMILEGESAWICPGQSITLHATIGLANYSWSNGNTTNTNTISIPGTYWVTSINAGCPSFDTIIIYQHPFPPQVILNPAGPNVLGCLGDSVPLAVANPIYASYLWNFDGHTESAVKVADPGIYWVVAKDVNGCTDTSATLTVTFVPKPIPNLGPDTTICTNDSFLLNPGTFSSYTWQDGSNNPTFTVTVSGYYTVDVKDANGCNQLDGIFLVALDGPTVSLGPDQILCQGQTLDLDAGTGYTTYTWQDNSNDQTFTVNAPGVYTVVVTQSNGCDSRPDSVVVQMDNPFSPGILFDGSTLSVSAYTSYQWFFDGELIPGATGQNYAPQNSGWYSCLVTNPNGCQVPSQPYEVKLKVTINTGFSPNSDGIGDFFIIENIDRFPGSELKIFNRWGQVMYERINYANNWNGESQDGQTLPDGTYFFTLDLKDGSNQISDYIILNR